MRRRRNLGFEALESRELLDAALTINFVTLAYQDVLQRAPDQSGLTTFTDLLEQGIANRSQVALALLTSPEYFTDEVQALYSQLLNRPADPGGLAAYVAFLESGGTIEQVGAAIIGSAEYYQNRGGGSNDGFLNALYQDILQRAVDPSGRATFDQLLANGATPQQIAELVYSSPEYQQDLVETLYRRYLNRAADPTGLSAFTALLASGWTDNQVAASLISSAEFAPGGDPPSTEPVLMANEVQALLQRAAAASSRSDAIIAIVDRDGRVLGVRVEAGVSPAIQNDPALLTFAVDGALAEARTGAFFANDTAPLTSRTIEFISQSTMTQREVDSSPDVADPNSPQYGPGFVAPVGVGGHFPPGINDTPSADLFNIEASNRDSILHPGADGNKSSTDSIQLPSRFNIPQNYLPTDEELQPPESYGLVSGIDPYAQARGIGTLPGGMPIFKDGALVGGIGVFFPGTTGYATEENSSLSATYNPALADLSVVAEYMAFAALGGSTGAGVRIGTLGGVAPLPGFDLPFGQITLAGIILPLFGPPGANGTSTLAQFGAAQGTRNLAGDKDLPVDLAGDQYLDGSQVPVGWLVTPHAGGGLTAADVVQIITQGINQANQTRAAIRLPLDSTARMVFSVSDTQGNILGLYRMPDATVFSIDVAVAKSRNTAYYANPAQLQPQDEVSGLPPGAAASNRTFRYLALPNYPEGIDGTPPGPFSILNDPGTNPQNGLETGPPLPASDFQSVLGYVSFHPAANFRDPVNPANQNGVIFFPGGVPLYKTINGVATLVGGLGVSGDGVDQDDVVTAAAAVGFTPPANITADNFFVNGVRLPYQNFDRNPEGGIN
jgi:uncharacterized protein GlcG (DUF336 family)